MDLNKFCSLFLMNESESMVDQTFNLNMFSINESFEATFLLPASKKSDPGQLTTRPNVNKANHGDLSMQIMLKKKAVKNQVNSNTITKNVEFRNTNQICINVGILRACGLKSCARYAFKNKKNTEYLHDIGLNVYIKVTLNEDTKQTRTITRTFTPEFYNYFDYMLPLLWSNEHTDAVPLAQMLENLNVVFELWHQVSSLDVGPVTDNDDTLIGLCSTPLKDLLSKQTGIKSK